MRFGWTGSCSVSHVASTSGANTKKVTSLIKMSHVVLQCSRCNLYAKAKNQKNKKSSEGKNELTPTKTRRKIFGRNRKYVLLGQPGPIRTHQTVQHVRVLICLKS